MRTDPHRLATALTLVLLLCGCGKEPDLSTPESAARAFCERLIEQMRGLGDEMVAAEAFEIECDLRELEWFADPSERRKLVDRKKARHEFQKAHLTELMERKVEIVETSDAPGGGKKVVVRITGKDVKEKKGAAGEWELVDVDEKMTLVLTQADGKWRVKER